MNHGARSARTHGFIVVLIGWAEMRIDEPNDAYRLSHKKMKLMLVQEHSRPIQIYFWQIPPIGGFMVGKSTASVAATASHHSRDSTRQLAKKKRNIPEACLEAFLWESYKGVTDHIFLSDLRHGGLVPWSGHVAVAWAKHAQDQLLQLQGPQSLLEVTWIMRLSQKKAAV